MFVLGAGDGEGGAMENGTAVASWCIVPSLEGRRISAGASSETISSISLNAVSCLQALVKVVAGYAAERSCCIADRLCSVLLADSQTHVKQPAVWA